MENKFTFLRTYFSPFKKITPKFYFGRVKIGVPIFLPRKWVNYTEKEAREKVEEKYRDDDNLFKMRYQYYLGCQYPVPKKVGFDIKDLFWKTKWSNTDYRFEFSPVWSFVFFGWQIAVIWNAPYNNFYWESWLTYHYATDRNLPTKERIRLARDINPNIWTTHKDGEKETVDYWDKVLKKKWQE